MSWHADGLRFRCEGVSCGNCCSGRSGNGRVWVAEAEMRRLAEHLGMAFDAFTRSFVRGIGARYSLVEKANADCVFYVEGKGCSVYEARPAQCRSFPFWPKILESRRSWEAQKEHCPGIGAGDLWSEAAVAEASRPKT